MEEVDFTKLIGLCAVIVGAWFAQVVGFSSFRTAINAGPPEMNVVDFDKDFSAGDPNQSIVEMGKERGWDISAPFVSEEEAERRMAEHAQKKWRGLAVGLAGMIGVAVFAYLLWRDWVTAVACVLVGPLGVAWGIQRANRNW